jgi:phage terminase Nu1 subunit (DNA packaging protein)
LPKLRWVGVGVLSDETGLAIRTLQYIVQREPGVLTVRNGKAGLEFEQPTCAVTLRVREGEKAAKKSAPAGVEESEARLAEAQAQMAELKLAEMQKRLMTAEQYERVVDDTNARVAARIKTLPQKLAPAVVGVTSTAEGLARVQPFVDELLDELYQAEDVPLEEAA